MASTEVGAGGSPLPLHHDRSSDLGLEYCPDEYEYHGAGCQQEIKRYPNFPGALAALLREARSVSEDLILADQL